MSRSARQKISFSTFHILSDVDLLYRGDMVVQLEPRAIQVLRYLAENHDRVISKEELLERVWPNVFTTDAVLKKAVLQARRVLGDDASDARFIQTYHGRGYQFVAPVVIGAAESVPQETSAKAPASSAQANANQSVRRRESVGPDYDLLVGRDTELAVLSAEYNRVSEGNGHPVLITGEPGIGKTQLARYFGRWVRQQGAVCVYARFFDYGGSRLAPYEVFLDLLRTALNLGVANRTGDDQPDLRELAEARLRVTLPEELFFNAGASCQQPRVDPGGDHFRAAVPISKCLVNLSRQKPLVMLLDDLQWADEASLDLIGYLMRTAQSEPLMVVGLARTEGSLTGDDSLSEWLKRHATYRSYTSLALEPLNESACREAIAAVFGENPDDLAIPTGDLETLQRATGGNPYFLTEMLRLLVAEGAIRLANNDPVKWKGIEDLHLPDTLVMAARAKLDRLSKQVRDVVEQAAVIGDEFRVETLSLMCETNGNEIEALLSEGVRRGVLSERGLSPGEDYRFYHSVLRQALYEALSPRHRKRLHATAACAIETVYARETDRIAGALSAHYEIAGNSLKTFDWSIRAWHAARSRWHWNEAVTHMERAQRSFRELEAAGQGEPNPGERLKVLLGTSECYCYVGRLRESESIVEEAISLAEILDDRPSLAAALLQRGLSETGLGIHREAIRSTERALEIYEQLDDQNGIGIALLQLGTVQIAMGEYERAEQLIEPSLKDVPRNTGIAAKAFGILGWARVLRGCCAQGVPLLERALEYHDRVGDVRQQAQMLRRLHWAHLTRGKFEAAISLARRARDQFRTAGDIDGEAKMNMGIGQARIGQGLIEEGVQRLNRVLEVFRLIGDLHCEAESLWLLGRAHLEAVRCDEAGILLKSSLEMLQRVGDRDDEFRVMTDIARLKIAEEDYLAGLGAADHAIEIAEELHNRDGLGVALVERARTCLKLNRPQKALEAAERAVALLDETESGERWRAYRTLASVLDSMGEKKSLRNKERALAALRKSVELIGSMRDEIDDPLLRATATRARSSTARQFHSLLLQLDLKQEAEDIFRDWLLEEPSSKSGQLRLVKLPKAI